MNDQLMSVSMNKAGRSNAVVVLLLAALLLTGCVGGPAGTVRQDGSGSIHIVENNSIDLAVREDFDAALQHLQEGRYEKAIELLNKVIRGSHNNSAPYINIAMAYQEIGEMERAGENLKKALEINPDHPVANNEYALLHRRSGRYIEARELYERLLRKYPDFLPARKNLGILCELYLNDAQCALAQYETYLASNPEDETVKIWIAGLKQSLGQ